MSVEERIDNVIRRINKEPFIFHREADIRALLYNELCKEYPEVYKTAFGYKTGLVHCEYYGGKGTRIDVVVLDKDDLKKTRQKKRMKSSYTDLFKITDAIEIKTVLGWYGLSRNKLAKGDIKKLVNLRKNIPEVNLYYLYIVRWSTKKKEKQKELLDLVKDLEADCKREGIKFKTNNRKKYFLGN